MGDDSELQNKMDTLRAEMETLDATMTTVGTKIDTLDVSMGTVSTKMDTLDATMTTVGTKVDTLDTSLGTVDASISNLITALDEMSSKYVTPENVSEVVSEYATKFNMINLGNSAGHAETGTSLTYDGSKWFYTYDGSDVIKFDLATNRSIFCTPPSSVATLCWDTTNNRMFAGESGMAAGKMVYVFDSTGVLTDSLVVYNPVPAPNQFKIMGLAHDTANDRIYISYYHLDMDSIPRCRYGILNPITGEITDYVELSTSFDDMKDAAFDSDSQVLYLAVNDPYSTGIELMGIYVATGAVMFVGELPTAAWYYIAFDNTNNIWHFWDGATANFELSGLAHIQRVSIADDGGVSITVDATSWPLPTGASTATLQGTMVTALQKIDDLQNALGSVDTDVLITQTEEAGSIVANNAAMSAAEAEIVAARADRKGLLIQNIDTADTVWIGPTGVLVGTGIELLPKQSVVLNHYTGSTASIYGICDAGKTANIRFLEAF